MIELSHKALSLLPKEDLDSRCIVSINLGIAYQHLGRMDAVEGALAEALKTGRATGNSYAISTALMFQGMALAVRGKLLDASTLSLALIQQEDSPAFILGLTYLYLSVLLYAWNDLEQSGKYLSEALKIAEHIHNDELLVVDQMILARIHIASGSLAATGDALKKAERKASEGEVSVPTISRLTASQVQYAIASKDMEAAAEWVGRLVDGCDYHSFHRFTSTTQAQYLIAQKKFAEALSHLAQCFQQTSQAG